MVKAYSCGYTDLNISCQAGTPTIRLGGDDYTVKNISYSTNTILLLEELDGNPCPRVGRNVSFGHDWLHYTSSYDNLTFSGCYSEPLDPMPSAFGPYQINCSEPGGGASFVLTAGELGKAVELHLAGRVMTDPRDFLGCLCSEGKVGVQDCKSSVASVTSASASRHGKRTTIYIVAGVSSFLLLCLVTVAFYLICKHGFLHFKSKDEPRIESFLQKNGNLHPKQYTYADVKRMTKSFSVKLGQGGFGAVYRGSLSDGHHVAVKMLKDTKGDGEEFMNEVASISRTSHVNVVTLLGFCLQGTKRALIYEYMPNGSLERYAFNGNLKSENTLTWEKLFDIAIGIARGLEYLHRGCNTRIVHFDIKPHNILLDQDFCPKISDFGLAKLCLNKESAISIVGARGTIGYIAPEVYSKQFGTVSSKSDVYSYGMMVLEMVGQGTRISMQLVNPVASISHSGFMSIWMNIASVLRRSMVRPQSSLER
ncbi:hypothetical protein ACP4OV_030282 [Aristida adscensionis]